MQSVNISNGDCINPEAVKCKEYFSLNVVRGNGNP